jgi:hypothetical protein
MSGIVSREEVQKEHRMREIEAEAHKPDDTAFKLASRSFRNVCAQIGQFIGDDSFRGGFEDYDKFINSPVAQSAIAQASMLASMWSGANEYLKYEGRKLGYEQPENFYKCWEYSDEELNSL